MLGARIAEQASCAIHLVHHTRKAPAGTEVTSGEPRRSPTRRAWCALNQMTEEDGAKAGVENHRLFFLAARGQAAPSPRLDAVPEDLPAAVGCSSRCVDGPG
jgi:hypothetical protein